MARALPYMYDNRTTAINLIDAQLEKIDSQATFAREQDRLEKIFFLHAASVDFGNRKSLDLELLLNQIGEIFKPDEEAPEDDYSLQAALSVQVCKTNFEQDQLFAARSRATSKSGQHSTRLYLEP